MVCRLVGRLATSNNRRTLEYDEAVAFVSLFCERSDGVGLCAAVMLLITSISEESKVIPTKATTKRTKFPGAGASRVAMEEKGRELFVST